MLLNLLDSVAQIGIRDEDMIDQVSGLPRYVLLRIVIISFQDLLVESLGVLVLERQITSQRGKQNDPCTPQICFLTDVLETPDKFGCCITRGATGCSQLFTRAEGATEAKVHDLQIFEVIKKQILRLDISVRNTKFPQVLDSRNQLLKQSAGLRLFQSVLGGNVVKKLPMTAVLHDQIESLLGFNYFIKLDDVRMIDNLKNVDLPSDSLHIANIYYPLLFKYLDCHLLLSVYVQALLDLPKSASAQSLLKFIIAYLIVVYSDLLREQPVINFRVSRLSRLISSILSSSPSGCQVIEEELLDLLFLICSRCVDDANWFFFLGSHIHCINFN